VLSSIAGCHAALPPEPLQNRAARDVAAGCLTAQIDGQVVDLDRHRDPIAGATILVMGDATVTRMALSNREGKFVVTLDPAHTEVAVFYGEFSKKQRIAELCNADAVIGIHSHASAMAR
jgi:hypothetical protein